MSKKKTCSVRPVRFKQQAVGHPTAVAGELSHRDHSVVGTETRVCVLLPCKAQRLFEVLMEVGLLTWLWQVSPGRSCHGHLKHHYPQRFVLLSCSDCLSNAASRGERVPTRSAWCLGSQPPSRAEQRAVASHCGRGVWACFPFCQFSLGGICAGGNTSHQHSLITKGYFWTC